MTVQTNTTVATGIGNGVTSVFPIPFKFNRAEDLYAILIDSETQEFQELTLDSDYTVSGVGREEGGAVTTTIPVPAGKIIKVFRIIDLLQMTDLRNQGKFFAEIHEDLFDRIVMMVQQLQEQLDRAVKVPPNSDTPADELYAEFKQDVADAEAAARESEAARDESRDIAEKFGDVDGAVTAAEQARDEAINEGRVPAVQAATSAKADADRAELYAAAAQANGSYTNIAQGLAATSHGQVFLVATSDPHRFGVYENASGSAVPLGILNIASQDTVGRIEDALNGSPWRSKDATTLLAGDVQFVNAVKKVVGTGFDVAGRALRIVFGIGYKNHPTYSDQMRMYVQGQPTQYWTFTGVATGKESGPVWIKLEPNFPTTPTQGVLWVLIDYRGLPDGTIVNNVNAARMLISPAVFDLAEGDSPAGGEFHNPIWRDLESSSRPDQLNPGGVEITKAIQVIDAEDLPKTGEYRITIFCKNAPTFGDRIAVYDQSGGVWLNGSPNIPGKESGPVWTTLTSTTRPGAIHMLVDYREISTDGIVLSSASSRNHVLSGAIYFGDEIRRQISPPSPPPESGAADTLPRAIRVALAGSSITWGSGWLGELSLVGTVDDYLRYRFASTVHGDAFDFSGNVETITNTLFFRRSASRVSGVGASASCTLHGDEISISIARPRGVEGAAVVDLYIDGSLYDSFDTKGNPVENVSRTFEGDGSTVKFDLGMAFTFDHDVSVGGSPAVVVMNTGGSGSSIPADADAMVVRALSETTGEVTHWLFFRTAPGNGVTVACNFKQGESITYVRGTVGQVDQGLDSQNESPYGDGATSYDPARPALLSSGLGFRSTDERSILSWHFDQTASRNVELRVRGLAPGATGTPELWLNFATNRMHRIMNAGIGGFSAESLLSAEGVNSIDRLIEFQPDVVLFEFCTNDDWTTHVHKAWNVRTGLTAEQVRDVETANFYESVIKVGENNYTVNDVRLAVDSMSPRRSTLSASSVMDIAVGDLVIFGEFFGDNRRLVARVITGWDPSEREISWGRPIMPEEVAGIAQLEDIQVCRVFAAPLWIEWMDGLISEIKDALPGALIGIGTSGIPNIRHRRLEGYRELGARIAEQNSAAFIDYYRATLDWQYSQPADASLFIDASQGTTSTGAGTYELYLSSGARPDPLAISGWNLRGWSVKVNGEERINRGCHIYGGGKRGWPDDVDPDTPLSNGVQAGDSYRVVFTDNVPPAGAEIVVRYASVKWAQDDCHPGTEGRRVMGGAACSALRALAVEAAAAMGAR